MKKFMFVLCYFLSPLIPLSLYLASAGFSVDTYTLSVVFGIFAFIFVCNQFLLASRPSFVVNAIGMKGLISFHSSAPLLILVFAGTHKILKELNGFGDDTVQATFGSVSWWTFAVVTVFTVLFMANTFWLKISLLKNIKDWVYKKTGLTYKGARLLHNVTVIAGFMILVHVFLASSSAFASNPVGFSIMAFWMLFSLSVYFSYRLKGRTVKGK